MINVTPDILQATCAAWDKCTVDTNPETIPLEIIEVQSGSYIEEEDIVRFEDTYGKTQ